MHACICCNLAPAGPSLPAQLSSVAVSDQFELNLLIRPVHTVYPSRSTGVLSHAGTGVSIDFITDSASSCFCSLQDVSFPYYSTNVGDTYCQVPEMNAEQAFQFLLPVRPLLINLVLAKVVTAGQVRMCVQIIYFICILMLKVKDKCS